MFGFLFRKKYVITMKSGKDIFLHAKDITKTYNGNDLIGLSAENCRDFPFYIRLDEIAIIRRT